MSDLRQAVHAEIDAFSPRFVPPLDAVLDRKRARARRHVAATGAALSAAAVAAAAVAVSSLSGGPDQLPTYAVSPAPGGGAGLDALVERCLGGAAATPIPGLVGMTELEAFPPNVRSALHVIARDGVCTPGSAARHTAAMTEVVIAQGRVVWAGRPVRAVPVPPQDPAGAELCKDIGNGGECYDLGSAQAAELAAALATGQPTDDNAPECAVAGAVYRVTWLPVSETDDRIMWTVPRADCQLMTAGDTKYGLDQAAHSLVIRMWDGAGLYAVNDVTTGKRPPSPPRE